MTGGTDVHQFDWMSLLEYAEARVACRSQFMRRLVINRAYYAAFHGARSRLRELGVHDADSRFHRQVWKRFERGDGAPPRDVRAWRTIGELGGRIRDERTRADYDPWASWSSDDCARIVADAREVVNRIGALTSR